MSDQIRNERPRKILGSSNRSSTANTTVSQSSSKQASKETSKNTNSFHSPMERLRYANVMGQQEMHALWPYGTTTFLSPVLPTHNVAVPYALASTLPYSAVPIYQSLPTGGPQQCNVSPVSSSSSASSVGNHQNTIQQQQTPQPQHALRSNLPLNNSTVANSCNIAASGGNSSTTNQNDSNKINIQIGLQCLSQNTPMNFNSMNNALSNVNFLGFCNTNATQNGEKENKEAATSQPTSPVAAAAEEFAAGGDANNVHFATSNGNTVILSQAKFNDLTRLALKGSEIAEKLAYTHRNRPCFKKIDSLCARMKQDLVRPDGVLANINSQGIAWAVKDFIFVFTRIINAWIIIKGYVYNAPDGLNKVKASLCPEFANTFLAWQDTTMDFIESLIKSFVNLDNLVQSQKNVYQKTEGANATTNQSTNSVKLVPSVNPLLYEGPFDFLNSSVEKSQNSTLNKNYFYTMVKDSEGSQRQATVNGTYFQTGTYNPIKKDSLLNEQSPTATAGASSNGAVSARSLGNSAATTPQMFVASNSSPIQQFGSEQLSEFWPSTPEIDPTTAAAINAVAVSSEFLKLKEKIPSNWLNYDLDVLDSNLADIPDVFEDLAEEEQKTGDKNNIHIIYERLMAMEKADKFFWQRFTKNYFPDFIGKYKNDYLDVRSIILKCEGGGYENINEVVHDMKKIIYFGKEFLKINGDEMLQDSINALDVEFNKLLNEPPLESCHFEHITGEPNESLKNYRQK